MKGYLSKAWEMKDYIKEFQIKHVSREENGQVDQLASLATALKGDLGKVEVIVEFLEAFSRENG